MNDSKLKKSIRNAIFSVLREQAKPKEEKPKASTETPAPDPKPKEAKPKTAEKPAPEQKAKKAPPGSINVARGAVGRGRFKKFVGEAAARSKKDPKGLMKDLGVKKAGGDDLNQVLGILQSAIFGNDTMAESYGGARNIDQPTDTGTVKAVGVTLRKLDARNGIKFIALTLEGAKNAGMLNLRGGIEIGRGDSADIAIYSS